MIGNADNVAGPGLVGQFAITGQEQHRIVQVHHLAAAHMLQFHAALEVPRTKPEKGNAVAVIGVHVGLDLEDEAADLALAGFDLPIDGRLRARRRRQLAKSFQQLAHAEIVDGTAEVDRRLIAFQVGATIERRAELAQHLDLFA